MYKAVESDYSYVILLDYSLSIEPEKKMLISIDLNILSLQKKN